MKSTNIRSLLELRNAAKKKKPYFVVKESKFNAGVKKRWRFPMGRHSAVRQMHNGRPAMPGTGYSSPKAVRGLHSSGLVRKVIHNLADILKLNPHEDGMIIASGVGNKKKVELLKFAKEKGIVVLNHKDTDQSIKCIEENVFLRKKLKEERQKNKSQKQEEKKKKAEEKKKKEESREQKEETIDLEEKNKQERQEQQEVVEKTITKRQ